MSQFHQSDAAGIIAFLEKQAKICTSANPRHDLAVQIKPALSRGKFLS
jgi:hypothetical protein